MHIDAVGGIRHNADMMKRYAQKLQDIEKVDLPSATVGMMIARQGVSANVGALKASLKLEEAILDLLA